MEDDWEALADKEIAPLKVSNKWVGEDDDDDVKESWEDEEKKDEEKVEPATNAQSQKPKLSKSKLAVLERLQAEEEELRLTNMTAEEKIAEKLRLQKLQMESDLNFALETFSAGSHSIDSIQPSSKEDFKEYGSRLNSKLAQYKDSPHFPQFIEDLVRNLCVHLSVADVKKVKISVETLHSEKLKQEKQQSKKPAGKNKLKVNLRTENDDIAGYNNFDQDYQDDYDDFM